MTLSGWHWVLIVVCSIVLAIVIGVIIIYCTVSKIRKRRRQNRYKSKTTTTTTSRSLEKTIPGEEMLTAKSYELSASGSGSTEESTAETKKDVVSRLVEAKRVSEKPEQHALPRLRERMVRTTVMYGETVTKSETRSDQGTHRAAPYPYHKLGKGQRSRSRLRTTVHQRTRIMIVSSSYPSPAVAMEPDGVGKERRNAVAPAPAASRGYGVTASNSTTPAAR